MFYLGLVFVLITIVGLIGNGMVILVIAVNRQLHDSTNFLIGNLAIADLLFLTFCKSSQSFFLKIRDNMLEEQIQSWCFSYSYMDSWHFSQSICYITVSLQYVTCYVSVWTLVLLSVERFLSIRNPTVARSIRRGRVVLYVCFSLWLSVFALNFPQMQGVGVLTFEYNGSEIMACVDSLSIANENATALSARIFYWGFNLGAYVLPLTASTIFYILLVSKLWVSTRVESKSSTKMKRHATKMVFAVILSFGLCWFPQHLRFFLRGLNYPNPTFWERDGDLLLVVQSAIQIMAYANSCVNPILYGALSERFRIGLKYAWRRFVCCDTYYRRRCGSSMQSRTPCTLTRPANDIFNFNLNNNKTTLTPKSSLGVESRESIDWVSGKRDWKGAAFLPATPASNLLTPAANGTRSNSIVSPTVYREIVDCVHPESGAHEPPAVLYDELEPREGDMML